VVGRKSRGLPAACHTLDTEPFATGRGGGRDPSGMLADTRGDIGANLLYLVEAP